MKITHLINSLDIGGAQKLLGDLLPELKKSGVDIDVVTLKKSNSEIEKILENNGIKIHYLNRRKYSPLILFKLKSLLKDSDIIHSHLFPMIYYVGIIKNIIKKPIILTEHSTSNRRRNHKWLNKIEKFIYKKYDNVVCISEATKNNLISWLNFMPNSPNIIVINNGINLNNFQKTESKNIFGRKGFPILMISRFAKSKDHETLIRAMSYIKNPDVFLVLVGDGETRKEMETLVMNLHLHDKVMFLGERKDIPDLIYSSHIGIQSSHWEGFGLTAIEMMAGGIPVIASEVEGLKQVVEGAGILFKKGDYKNLALQINNLLDNRTLYNKIKELGYQRSSLFSIESTSKRYLTLYKSLSRQQLIPK